VGYNTRDLTADFLFSLRRILFQSFEFELHHSFNRSEFPHFFDSLNSLAKIGTKKLSVLPEPVPEVITGLVMPL